MRNLFGSVLGVLINWWLLLSASAFGGDDTAGDAGFAHWRQGDAAAALDAGHLLVQDPAHEIEGQHLRVLALHALGRHAEAIAAFALLPPDAAPRKELRLPVYESLVHIGDHEGAAKFARDTQMPPGYAARADALALAPIAVSIPGVVGLPLADDDLTPLMPGLSGTLNGHETVFRFDTGGTYVVMTLELARAFGVESSDCESGFANLQSVDVCHGRADLSLGMIIVRNVPVAVVSSLPVEISGVALGPVLGTNFLSLFLVTIDGPRKRIIFSPRGNDLARSQHLAYLGGADVRIPFLLWGDHFIIARGQMGARQDLNFFVDSGLIAFAEDGVQAGFLLTLSNARDWGGAGADSVANTVVVLDTNAGMGGTTQAQPRALLLDDAAWSAFGKFGGIRVDGILSYGWLKQFGWTLDFDARELILTGVESP